MLFGLLPLFRLFLVFLVRFFFFVQYDLHDFLCRQPVLHLVLTAQLRDMEDKGLVTRHVYAEVPPRVEYSLTDLGKSLKPILDAMWTWGEGYKAQNS